MLTTGLQTERQLVDVQPRLLCQSETLHVDVERIVCQRLQDDVGTNVADVQVLRIEQTLRPGGVLLVVADT